VIAGPIFTISANAHSKSPLAWSRVGQFGNAILERRVAHIDDPVLDRIIEALELRLRLRRVPLKVGDMLAALVDPLVLARPPRDPARRGGTGIVVQIIEALGPATRRAATDFARKGRPAKLPRRRGSHKDSVAA